MSGGVQRFLGLPTPAGCGGSSSRPGLVFVRLSSPRRGTRIGQGAAVDSVSRVGSPPGHRRVPVLGEDHYRRTAHGPLIGPSCGFGPRWQDSFVLRHRFRSPFRRWRMRLTKRWSGRVVDKVPGVMRLFPFTRGAGAIVCTAAAQRPR